jgi:hypothetical protein
MRIFILVRLDSAGINGGEREAKMKECARRKSNFNYLTMVSKIGKENAD